MYLNARHIRGFEFVLDGMLNIHASDIRSQKRSCMLWKFNVSRPFVGKTPCMTTSAVGERRSVMPSARTLTQNRYRDKLKLLGLKEDEDSYKNMNFVDDTTLWSPVLASRLYCMQQLLQWGPWKLYKCNVHTVEIWANKGDTCILRVLVDPWNPSQASPDKSYHMLGLVCCRNQEKLWLLTALVWLGKPSMFKEKMVCVSLDY